jgi:hypothetical protein
MNDGYIQFHLRSSKAQIWPIYIYICVFLLSMYFAKITTFYWWLFRIYSMWPFLISHILTRINKNDDILIELYSLRVTSQRIPPKYSLLSKKKNILPTYYTHLYLNRSGVVARSATRRAATHARLRVVHCRRQVYLFFYTHQDSRKNFF